MHHHYIHNMIRSKRVILIRMIGHTAMQGWADLWTDLCGCIPSSETETRYYRPLHFAEAYLPTYDYRAGIRRLYITGGLVAVIIGSTSIAVSFDVQVPARTCGLANRIFRLGAITDIPFRIKWVCSKICIDHTSQTRQVDITLHTISIISAAQVACNQVPDIYEHHTTTYKIKSKK